MCVCVSIHRSIVCASSVQIIGDFSAIETTLCLSDMKEREREKECVLREGEQDAKMASVEFAANWSVRWQTRPSHLATTTAEIATLQIVQTLSNRRICCASYEMLSLSCVVVVAPRSSAMSLGSCWCVW